MKKILALYFCILTALAGRAVPIDSIFYHAPAEVLPLLEGNTRLDMLDLYNYGMAARGTNIFGGTSQLLKKGTDYMHVKLTEVSEWELKVLPAGQDVVLCTVHTISGMAGGSEVNFYGINWLPLEMTRPELTLKDFWKTDSLPAEEMRKEWEERLSPVAVTAHWSADNMQLVYTLSAAALNRVEREEIQPFLRTRVYGWVNGRFTPIDR